MSVAALRSHATKTKGSFYQINTYRLIGSVFSKNANLFYIAYQIPGMFKTTKIMAVAELDSPKVYSMHC